MTMRNISVAVDIDERQTEWRVKDWTGDSQSADLVTAHMHDRAEQVDDTVRRAEVQLDEPRDESGAASRSTRADAGKDV